MVSTPAFISMRQSLAQGVEFVWGGHEMCESRKMAKEFVGYAFGINGLQLQSTIVCKYTTDGDRCTSSGPSLERLEVRDGRWGSRRVDGFDKIKMNTRRC